MRAAPQPYRGIGRKVYGADVKPWSTTLRTRVTSPLVVLAMSALIVTACTTVASGERAVSSGSESGSAVVALVTAAPSALALTAPTALATAAPSAPATPVVSATPTWAATVRPSPEATATPSPSPSPSPVFAAEPSASPLPEARVEAAASALGQKTAAKLQRILDKQVNDKDVAGLQAAVRLPDGEVWLGSAGVAEFDPARPIADDTQFAIASVTKTFVAALILQLAQEGQLDLDATFGRYFRDAPRKDSVTVRQLLSHTSGIYNYWANPRYTRISEAWWKSPNAGGLKARSHQWTYEEMLKLVKSGGFKPGKDYEYSNTNYLILGKVAESVTGQPLHKLLRRRFAKPLGLDDTIYQPAQKPRVDAAHGHWGWPGGHTDHTKDSRYVPFMAAASIADAAGAMASTARDLAEWAAALYGGNVLSAQMRAQMTDFQRPGWYGLGADVAVFAGHRAHGHRGGIRGYESSMWYFPDSGVSIVLLSNQGNWPTDPVMAKLVKAVLGSA